MKVIDILNKIANGEEIPEKFRFAGQIFEKQGSYIEDEDGDSIFESILTDFSNINEEVEIIEDNKIEFLPVIEVDAMDIDYLAINQTRRKINEIIDYLNKEK